MVTGPRAEYWPIVISRKNIGIPIRNNMMQYGIRKAAPPYLKQRYGKRQTFPRPGIKAKVSN